MLPKKRIAELAGLNGGIAAANIIAFSKGLLGLSLFSGNIVTTALSLTTLGMSTLAFFYGNYKIITSPEKIAVYKEENLIEEQDYVQALKDNQGKKIFSEDIELVISQIGRLKQKNQMLQTLLEQEFSSAEMSYARFMQIISSVVDLFYSDVRSIINRLIIFDYSEYTNVKSGKLRGLTQEQTQAKLKIFDEHVDYIHNKIDKNENILLKLDSLLLEVSKLDDVTESEIEKLEAIKNLNDLIEQTKLYKD
ncbi:MAG: hypothetical protein Q4F95_02405 [Oscillospiraceae bacterium]|nr:hypothetical protein [Oscillospiraceae bacterium]